MPEKYNILCADPPWVYANKKTGGSMKSGSEAKYPTMTIEEICNLDIDRFMEKDSILFLWITNPLLFDYGPKVLDAWGYKYKTLITWHKTGRLGMGFWFRGETEHLIVAKRGKVKCFRCPEPNFIETKTLKHSQKPSESFELIDRAIKNMPYARKLELFSREKHSGWDAWGYGVDGVSVEEKIRNFES